MGRDRAVSPVIGVAIIIGLTVAMAVTVGVFTTDLVGSQTNSTVEDQPEQTATPADNPRAQDAAEPARPSTTTSHQIAYLCGTSSRQARRQARRGQLPANATGPVLPGGYATTVYLTNPSNDTATVSLSINPRDREHQLQAGGTLAYDCQDFSSLNQSDSRTQVGVVSVSADAPIRGVVVTTVAKRGGTTVTKRQFSTLPG